MSASTLLCGKYLLINKNGYLDSASNAPIGSNESTLDSISHSDVNHNPALPYDYIFDIHKIKNGFGYVDGQYSCAIAPSEWENFKLIEEL